VTELNRIIHEPARLQIVILLSGVKEAGFLYLLHESGLTKGNLASHLAKLEEIGYIEIGKSEGPGTGGTIIRLTTVGAKAFKEYKNTVRKLLE
jgi:DNA-binding MarR family transcriptional regulator